MSLRSKIRFAAHIYGFSRFGERLQSFISIRHFAAYGFIFSGQAFSLPFKAPADSNRLERGTAMALRAFLCLLLVYIVFHKIFPFTLLRGRLADMTGADFVL